MNDLLNRLYFRAPVWVQNGFVSTYGAVLRRRRYGGVHRAQLTALLESERWDADRLRAHQLERLNHQLRAAAETPLYDGRLPTTTVDSLQQLRDFPLLTKQEMRRPKETLVRRGAQPTIEIHTGGTTGTPLSVYCDAAAVQRNYAFFERFKRWAGCDGTSRVATFAGRTVVPAAQTRGPYWRFNRPGRAMLLSSYHISERTIPEYVRALAAFGPDLIDSYPSSIEPLARHLVETGNESIRPRAVITSSETLTPEVRATIEAAFGCRVHDHYGSAEMVALITQCEHGSYHPNPEFGVLEILNDGEPAAAGEVGEIVATGFVNDVAPILRYRTGDLAAFGDASCPCGRAFPTITRLEGRKDDVLVTPEGRLIGRLDPIFKAVSSFYETQLVQTTATDVVVRVVPSATYRAEDEEVVLRELARRLGPSMSVRLERVASIPRTASGKFRAVVNEASTRRA